MWSSDHIHKDKGIKTLKLSFCCSFEENIKSNLAVSTVTFFFSFTIILKILKSLGGRFRLIQSKNDLNCAMSKLSDQTERVHVSRHPRRIKKTALGLQCGGGDGRDFVILEPGLLGAGTGEDSPILILGLL